MHDTDARLAETTGSTSDAPAQETTASQFIEVRNLCKRIGRQEILRDVSFTVSRGQTLVIIGRSGVGKSVLLKHLIGLMKPTSGDILVDGQSIVALRERQLGKIRKKIGILFQGAALFDSMNVADNVAFPLREQGLRDPAVLARKVAEALEVVDLAGEEKKMPENLSGGMRKRVGLARAIISQPACILYDEPNTGLDPIASDSINHLMRRMQKRFKITSIAVTHDMKTAFFVADRIAYLHEGAIYFYGTAEELRASTDPVIQDFIIGRSGDTD